MRERPYTYQGLRIWFFGYVTLTLEYSADLILLVFSISCSREFYLSNFTHLIGLHIWFFGYVAWTLEYCANLILLAFSISCGGEFYLSRFTHLLGLRVWFFAYVTWTLEHSANLILLTFTNVSPFIRQCRAWIPFYIWETSASCHQFILVLLWSVKVFIIYPEGEDRR